MSIEDAKSASIATHFIIQPSLRCNVLIGGLYILTGIVALSLQLPYRFKILILILHGMHFYTVWWQKLSLKAKESIIYLQYTPQKTWVLGNSDGEAYSGILQPGSLCTPFVVLLYFKLIENNTYVTLLLFEDSISQAGFRQLKQRLRQHL